MVFFGYCHGVLHIDKPLSWCSLDTLMVFFELISHSHGVLHIDKPLSWCSLDTLMVFFELISNSHGVLRIFSWCSSN